jgi:hypothetical protein
LVLWAKKNFKLLSQIKGNSINNNYFLKSSNAIPQLAEGIMADL